MLSGIMMHSSLQPTPPHALPMLSQYVTPHKIFLVHFTLWACLCCRYVADPSMHSMPAITPNPAGTAIICQSLDNQVSPSTCRLGFALDADVTEFQANAAEYICLHGCYSLAPASWASAAHGCSFKHVVLLPGRDVLDQGPLQAEPQEDVQGPQHSGVCLPGQLQPRREVCHVRWVTVCGINVLQSDAVGRTSGNLLPRTTPADTLFCRLGISSIEAKLVAYMCITHCIRTERVW